MLKIKIDELSEKACREAIDYLDKVNIDLDFSDESAKLLVGDTSYDLPSLPSTEIKEKS